MELINAQTGKPATDREYEAARRRAFEIMQSPYSSPEQIEWALQFPGTEYVFWESANEKRLRKYQDTPR
jgi:hypothetical protein